MKPKKCRKVHAQRKFAQGAYVPATAGSVGAAMTAVSSIVRSDISPALPQPTPSAPHNLLNLNASNLLDIVSLQGLHTHLPVVMIERMKTEDNVMLENGTRRGAGRTMVGSSVVGGKVGTARARRNLTARTRLLGRNSSMCLRSRNQQSSMKIRPAKVSRPIKRPRPPANTSDIEDERPLKYYKNSTKVTPQPEMESSVTSVRQTRSSRPSQAVNGKAKMTRRERERKVTPKLNGTGGGEVPTRQASVAKAKEECSKRKGEEQAAAAVTSSAAETKDDTEQVTKTKEKGCSKRKGEEQAAAAVTSSTVKLQVDAEQGDGTGAMQYYGSQGIVRWLERGACPAAKLRTVREAAAASPSVLSRLCGTCAPCRRVRTVRDISRLMGPRVPRRQSVPAASAPSTPSTASTSSAADVYTFQVDADGDERPPMPLYARRKRPSTNAPSTSAAPTPADDTQLLLDLDGDSDQLLKITSVPIPGTNKKMMRARIVPRDETRCAPDMLLEEHGDLLEQLLHTLTQTPASTPPLPLTPLPPTPLPLTPLPTPLTPLPTSLTPLPTPTPTPPPALPTPYNETLVEAPIFYPTEEEFADPIAFFERVKVEAAPFGICKVVAPPSFRPSCVLHDEMKFKVTNHYIARFYNRWGPAAREISAMKAYLATQNVKFSRVPRLDGLEVNLPRLYRVVQSVGGLERVLEDNLWSRVAEEMRLTCPNPDKMLDTYYVKYLLPYETATDEERRTIMDAVERKWEQKYRKLLQWAANPLHHQKKLLGESDSSSSDTEAEEDEPALTSALNEAEDCIVPGRSMNLSAFKKVAQHAACMFLPHAEATLEDIEEEYWRLGTQASDHVAVNAASVDTKASGYGFPKNRDPFAKHKWNLKNLSTLPSNLLRALGSVVGVTEPTLHLGMLYSTSCWHSDPHRLAWLEYHHEGHPKIWYGVGGSGGAQFREAVQALCPMSCQNKGTWLSSEIAMIPPQLLRERGVTLTRCVQRPGEFVLVLPDAYSCAFCTGYSVSESAYFATYDHLEKIVGVFEELRASCEPTTFSVEQLLLGVIQDSAAPLPAVLKAKQELERLVMREYHLRKKIQATGIGVHLAGDRGGGSRDVHEHSECSICRATLYLSKVTGLIDKKSALCLMHADMMISNNPDADLSGVELKLYYSKIRLNDFLRPISRSD